MKIEPDVSKVSGPCTLHLTIVKHCKALVKSLDSDLRELINSIQKRQCKVEEISSYDDALDYAVKFVAVTLGECLIKQTAALLPKLFETLRKKTPRNNPQMWY